MTALQKVILGTPPAAVDGDTSRGANTKMNSNVDVLNAQAVLTSAPTITVAQALTIAHVGKRVNIILNAAGVINLPAASTCAADNVLLLRNLGTTVVTLAVTVGSGDGVSLSRLNPGEAALMDTDGVHTWSVLMRGRTNSDNETVNGNCAVNGNETVAGTLAVTGATALAALSTTGVSTLKADTVLSYASPKLYLNDTSAGNGAGMFRWVSNSGVLLLQHNTAAAGDYSTLTTPLSFSAGDVATFSQRPTWAGATPWDSGNLTPSLYARLDGSLTYTGGQTQSGVISTVGAFRATADMGTAFAAFGTTAAAALQMDCPNDSAAYFGLRWTHWTSRHLAGIAAYAGGTGTSIPSIVFAFAANTSAFSFYASGSATFAGTLTQNSDYRIKANVEEIDPQVALTALLDSRPVSYDRTDNPDDTDRHVGFIAHELQAQLPLLVRGVKDGMRPGMPDASAGPSLPPKDVPDLQSVNYIGMVPYLVAALQALNAKIEAMEGSR